MKILVRAMIPTMAALLVPGLVAASASAATLSSLRITNPNKDGSFTAATSAKVTIKSSNGAVNVTCDSSAMKGTIDTVIGSNGLGAVDQVTFSGCQGADGSRWIITWQNTFSTSTFVTAFANGVATIRTTPDLRLSNEGTFCELGGGQLDGTYSNTGSRLAFTDAAVTSAGCGVTTADSLQLSLGYTVTPAITISDEPPIFSVSGSTGADGAFSSTGTLHVFESLGSLDVNCAHATRSGVIPNADNVSGAFGSISSASYEQCTDRDGRAVTIRPLDLPWSLQPQTYFVDQGLLDGQIVDAQGATEILEVSLSGCSFTVTNFPDGDFHSLQIHNVQHALVERTIGLASALNCGLISPTIAADYVGDIQPSTIQVTAR